MSMVAFSNGLAFAKNLTASVIEQFAGPPQNSTA